MKPIIIITIIIIAFTKRYIKMQNIIKLFLSQDLL